MSALMVLMVTMTKLGSFCSKHRSGSSESVRYQRVGQVGGMAVLGTELFGQVDSTALLSL